MSDPNDSQRDRLVQHPLPEVMAQHALRHQIHLSVYELGDAHPRRPGVRSPSGCSISNSRSAHPFDHEGPGSGGGPGQQQGCRPVAFRFQLFPQNGGVDVDGAPFDLQPSDPMLCDPPPEGDDVVVEHLDHPVGGDEGAVDRGVGGDIGNLGGQQPTVGHRVGHETGSDDRVIGFVDKPPG